MLASLSIFSFRKGYEENHKMESGHVIPTKYVIDVIVWGRGGHTCHEMREMAHKKKEDIHLHIHSSTFL